MNRLGARRPRIASFGVAPLLAMQLGCTTSLSGLKGNSDYACKAPEGVTCQSVSGTYANAVANNVPSTRRQAGATQTPSTLARPVPDAPIAPAAAAPAPSVTAPAAAPSTTAGAPIRSAPLILRLWFKAWEDADGDLFDQGHVYVQVNGGRWLVEHAQRTNREAHSPVRAAAVRGTSEPPPVVVPASRGSASLAPLSALPALPALPVRPASAGATNGDQERE